MKILPATLLFPGCLLLLLTACATTPRASFDHDPGANLSGYRTWYWLTDDRAILPAGREPEISPLILGRIADSIERQLSTQGYGKAASRAEADFVVTFTVGSREKVYVESYPWRYRGPWYWRPYYWDTDFITRTYTVGVLAIDIFDQQSRAPVWHGWTSKRVTAADRKAPDQPINDAVAAILANFPPPAASPAP